LGDLANTQAETRVNAEQASKQHRGSRPAVNLGKAAVVGEENGKHPTVPPGYWRRHVCKWKSTATRETSAVRERDPQPELREEQAGPFRGGGEARSSRDAG
jgi:hypothetical protein